MPDGAHDVSLLALFVDGVAHGLAIDSQALVLLAVGRIPLLQRSVEQNRINADQYIADDRLTGHEVTSVFTPTAKALAGLGAQVLSPSGDGLVALHPAQDCPGSDGQHYGQAMTPALGAAGIGDTVKEIGQGAHELGGEHDLGGSGEFKMLSVRMSQEHLGIAA